MNPKPLPMTPEEMKKKTALILMRIIFTEPNKTFKTQPVKRLYKLYDKPWEGAVVQCMEALEGARWAIVPMDLKDVFRRTCNEAMTNEDYSDSAS